METLLRDIRHTFRGLLKTPVFAFSVVFTLALGIGGNTAVFSVVDQLLLRPLPYPDGNQLVTVDELSLGRNSRADVSPANWLDWQRESRTFRQFAAWQVRAFTLTGAGEPRRVTAQLVSAEFFPLLGVAPLLGRTISEEDDRLNGPRTAVISYRAWPAALHEPDPTVVASNAVCCWRRSGSTVCSRIWSPNGRRTSASASLLAHS